MSVTESLLGYTGQYRDAVGGGYSLGNGYRRYLPGSMRFNAPDSLSPFGPGGVNPYVYCAGDPINRVDPSGHAPFNMTEMADAIESAAHATRGVDMPIAQARAQVSVGDLIYGTGYPGRGGARNEYATRPGFEWITKEISTIDQYYVLEYERTEAAKANWPKPEHLDDFAQAVRRHPKYSSILDTSTTLNVDAWARKSKAGLFWATHSDKPRIRVHFLLDDLDFPNVVEKRGMYGKSITSRELRWLYRNRLDPQVQAGVQFWMWGKPVAPPWTRQYARAMLEAEWGSNYMDQFSEADVERALSGPSRLWSRYQPKRLVGG